jgi:sulfonate transport system substrate-binding protein
MTLTRRKPLLTLLGALLLGSLTAGAKAEDKPKEIRFAYPGVGVGNRPASSGNIGATAHLRGAFEEEFKKDGIAVKWTFLRGAGPAVNELFANGLVDFAPLGDLPSVIGKAGGLKTRMLAAASVRGNIYIAVPADSTAQTVKDLRGKRIAVTKGTATHLAGLKVFERFGLTDKDIKLVNMDVPSAQLALATKDIDAAIGGADSLRIRDQGIARIVYTTRGEDPDLTSNTSFVGSDEFIKKYPQIAQRVLNVYVKTAVWLAETKPTQVFQLWTKSGTTFSSFREDLANEDFKYRFSPLIDPYIAARYKLQINEAKRLGLVRTTFTFNDWVEPRFLNQALEGLKLRDYWQPRRPDGKPVTAEQPKAQLAPSPAAASSGG